MADAQEEESRQLLVSPHASLEVENHADRSVLGPGHAAACRALQASHFLSTWGQRGWEFTIGLIMLELHPSSLAFVALWGLLDSALSVTCGAAVGAYVDAHPRFVAASRMYVVQNSCVAGSAAAALWLLWGGARAGAAYWGGLALTMAAGAVSTLGALGSTLSVEREWTKALCGSNNSALAGLNAAMKRIDLTCLIASPLMVGLIMQYGGGPPMVAATLVLLAWNMLAWAPEILLLRYAQRCSPALAADRPFAKPSGSGSDSAGAEAGGDAGSSDGGLAAVKGTGASSRGRSGGWRRVAVAVRRQVQPWVLYARQPAAPAALALALLYLTVLSFGTLMTAYLKSLGLPEAELAAYRGLGALSGILATLTFPPLHRRLGLVPIGALSIWLQLACLLCAVLPAALAALGSAVAPRARTYALVWGLVLSRFGLWSFDLAINQLVQETTAHGVLGSVAGVQGSLQSLCQMGAYGAGVLHPSTDQFTALMAASCCVVGLAAALFTAFALRTACGRGLHSPAQALPAGA